MASRETISRSEITTRRATASDYEGVMAISHGIFGGDDIIPSVYHEYLQDKNRVFYVALYKDRVVGFSGGRIIDNGETYEAEGVRTDPNMRGLSVLQQLQSAVLTQGVFPHYPHVKRVRYVTLAVNVMRRKHKERVILPFTTRTIHELIWKQPIPDFLSRFDHVKRNFNTHQLSMDTVIPARKQELDNIFNHASTQWYLFPGGVIIRDSQSFTVGPKYASNIPLILGDNLHAMYMSRTQNNTIDSDVTKYGSFSFGTALEASVTRENLRYQIDYYGIAEVESIKTHIMKHLLNIPTCLKQSQNATHVIFEIFIPNYIYEIINVSGVIHFVSKQLGFGTEFCSDSAEEQCVGDFRAPPHVVADVSKL